MNLTWLLLFAHFHTVHTGKLEDEFRKALKALNGITFSPPDPPNLANSPSDDYPRADYIRVSFCHRERAKLVHGAALDVTDAITVTIEKLQALKIYVSKLPRDTAEWADRRLESTMRHYRTYIDVGFWAPDTFEPAIEEKFGRKLRTLSRVIFTATAMKFEMSKDTPLVEVTCGYDWLSKTGPDISIGGSGAFKHQHNAPNVIIGGNEDDDEEMEVIKDRRIWYYDRRNSVALPRQNLRRWIKFPLYERCVKALDNSERFLDDQESAGQVKTLSRGWLINLNLPPLVEILSLSNYMWRNWTTSETLRTLRHTRYYPLRKESLSTIIQPNLATALLASFPMSPQMTGAAGPFEPGDSVFDPETYKNLHEWASTAPVRSAMELDDIDYFFNLREHRAAFVFLVVALYLDN